MSSDLSVYDPPQGTIHYPDNNIVGVVDTDQALALTNDLKTDGATGDEIGVLTPERRDDFAVPIEGGGLSGTMQRMVAGSGGELDLVGSLRDGLRPGRVLIRATIGGDAESRHRTAETFWRHVHHLTRFKIELMRQQPSS